MKSNPEQAAVDFCAAKTMELLGTLPMPQARKFLTGFLLLTPHDSPVIGPFRELHEQISAAESKRTALASGQLTLNLGLDDKK